MEDNWRLILRILVSNYQNSDFLVDNNPSGTARLLWEGNSDLFCSCDVLDKLLYNFFDFHLLIAKEDCFAFVSESLLLFENCVLCLTKNRKIYPTI